MPRSVVDLAKLNALDAAIRSFDSNTGASMAAYRRSASEMLDQFEAKLAQLGSIRNQKLSALQHCQYLQQFNENLSCAFQAQAFYDADDRYRRCAELVMQARDAVSEYESHAGQFRQAKSNLCSRARVGIDRVRATIDEYTSNLTPNTDNIMPGNASVNLTNSADNQSQGNRSAAFMFVPGAASKDGKEDGSVRIENLPPVVDPDQKVLHAAAKDISNSLKGEGSTIGTKELLLQQKADAVFEQQYGISKTDLLAASGPQKSEYIDAYNRIQKGILSEMKLL
jgi:hypothetical protein